MNSYPSQQEIAKARARLKLAPARVDQQQQAGFQRAPEQIAPPPAPIERSQGGVSGFLKRITAPMIDLPDQTNPVLRFGEQGIESLTSPVGILSAVLAPVSGGASLGLRGAAGLGARLSTRLAAEAAVGAAAGLAAEKTAEALEDAPGIIKVPATLAAGVLAGGAAVGGIRGLSKIGAAADDTAKVVANTVAQAQDAFTPEANEFIDALGKAKNLMRDKDVMAGLKEQRARALGSAIGRGEAAEQALGIGASTNARIGAFMEQLRGPQPKLEFPEIGLPPETINALRTQVWESGNLTQLDRLDATRALETIFEAQGLPSRYELAQLEKVFGPALTAALEGLRPYGLKAILSDIINLPRSIMASGDASFGLNQGLLGLTADPKVWGESVKRGLRAMADPAFAKEQDLWVRGVTGTDFHKAASSTLQKAGLDITGSVGKPEELFQASDFILRKVFKDNTAGSLLAASERGYVGTGNYMRTMLGEKTLAKMADLYIKPGMTPEQALAKIPYTDVKRLTDTINVMTGRSSWDVFKRDSGWANSLNAFFFAPSFLASRVQAATLLPQSIYSKVATEGIGVLANPIALYKADPILALQARAMGGFVAQGVSVLGAMKLAKQAGLLPNDVDVEFDPRSSNFGKIKIGPTQVDFWGGYSQMARMIARASTGEAKSQGGNIYPVEATDEIWNKFFRSKTAPVPGLAWNVITGTTFNGERTQGITELDDVVRDMMMPLALQDIMQGYMEGGYRSAAIQSTAILGTRTTSFQSVSTLKDSVAQEKFGKPYKELRSADRKIVDNNSLVLDKQREFDQVAGDNFSSALQDNQIQRSQNENIIAARYLATGNIKEFTDAIEDQQLIYATRRDAAAKQFNLTETAPNSPLQQALQGWYALFEQADIGFEQGIKVGEVDWNRLEALRASYRKKLTREQAAFIDDQTSAPHDPSVQWYFNNKKYISESGYYEVADQAFERYRRQVADEGIESYSDLATAVALGKRDGRNVASLERVLKAVDKAVAAERMKRRKADPNLDAALISIGRAGAPASTAAKRLLAGG